MSEHVVIVGAGIVGLASGYALARRGMRVTVLEKEDRTAAHQTGNNSGVVHSGLYYLPGSLKATMGVAGSHSMTRFAREHGVDVDVCGKLVVATSEAQLGPLHELLRRGEANGVPCRLVSTEEAAEYEPHVACVGALRVESTAIIDYRGVCSVLKDGVEQAGGEVRLRADVREIRPAANGVTVVSTAGEVRGTWLVNCAGLHSDRIARLAGVRSDVRILPFRGEYFELAERDRALVRGLIYPVPDPALPFLGVHLTRMIGGGVHAGPNAVLALAREGYRWRDVDVRDLYDSATWPGLWSMGRRFWKVGAAEVSRSLSRRRFLASLRELVPGIGDELIPAHAGVRAQAVRRDGTLVDDFHLERAPHQLHVLNAPSPAATASLEIGRRIADELTEAAA